MIVCFKSEAGSIRDDNHDFVLHDERLGLVVIAGGVNLKLQDEAKSVANSLVSSLTEFHSVMTSEESKDRLKEVVRDIASIYEITGVGNFILALWLVNGFIVGVSIGNTAVISLADENSILLSRQEKDGACKLSDMQCFDCLEVIPGNKVVIVSEGIVRALRLKELYANIALINDDKNLTPASVLNVTKKIYSGDDNTAVVIEFSQKDKLQNTPEEIILKTHFNRQFSIKLWQPLAIFTGFFVAVALVLKKSYGKIKNQAGLFNQIRKMKNRK